MGLLTSIMHGVGIRASYASQPSDDFWYSPVSRMTEAGVPVTPDSALTIGAVFAAVRLLAETVGALPCDVFERLAIGKRAAPEQRIQQRLSGQANAWQTSQEWREMMTGHCVLRGNGYSRIVSGREGFAEELVPLHPDRVTVEQQQPSRRLVYTHRPARGAPETYTQDEMFHLRGLGDDGITGYSVITYARRSMGLSIAMESHAARLFSQGARLGGIVTHKGTFGSKEARENFKADWQRFYGGLEGAHKTAVLEEGMNWQAVSMTSEDAQFLESREFGIRDVARWFNIPEHMLRVARQPTFASIEQFGIEFVVYSLLPWVTRWEQTIGRDLILDPVRFFAKLKLQGLLRGDNASRGQFYRNMVETGIMTRNECRALEDLDPLEGLDEPLTPLNMARGTPPAALSPGLARSTSVLADTATRAVRREIADVSKAATPSHLADVDGWRAWVDQYYARHAAYLSEALHLDLADARTFALAHRAALLAEGPDALDRWESEAPAELLALCEAPAPPVDLRPAITEAARELGRAMVESARLTPPAQVTVSQAPITVTPPAVKLTTTRHLGRAAMRTVKAADGSVSVLPIEGQGGLRVIKSETGQVTLLPIEDVGA